MSTYVYTKPNVSLEQLESEILTSAVPHNSLGCTNNGELADNLSIDMEETLTAAEQALLENIVNSHTSVPVFNAKNVRCIEMSFAGAGGNSLKSKQTTYNTLASFIFQGTDNIGIVGRIAIGVNVDIGIVGSIRIWNRDTGLVVGEETGIVNTELAILSMEPISNLPRDESILEIQIKTTGGSKKDAAYLHCLTMYFE